MVHRWLEGWWSSSSWWRASDAKEDNCDSDMSTSDQFSWTQLRTSMILVLRRQTPSTNALDGLYSSCVVETRLKPVAIIRQFVVVVVVVVVVR